MTVGRSSSGADDPASVPNNHDVTIRPHGPGDQTEIVWTEDRIVYGLAPDQIVTLDIAS